MITDWKFKSEPWPHQLEGCELIDRQPSTMLADDMGTGKSKQIVDAFCNLNMELGLIMCPKTVCPVWPQQFERHGTVEVEVLVLADGSVDKRANWLAAKIRSQRPGQKLMVVCNYDAAWRGRLGRMISNQRWNLLGMDESHRIKSASARCSRFVGRMFRWPGQKRICLSGTPLAHSLLDAFGQYRFLDHTIFGLSLVRFRSRYCIMGGFEGRQVSSFQNTEEFNRRFYSIGRRVMACDVLTLTECQHIDVPVSLSETEKKVYVQMDAELVADVQGGIVTAANAAVRVMRLQQCTSGFAKRTDGEEVDVGTSKQDALTDILDGIS